MSQIYQASELATSKSKGKQKEIYGEDEDPESSSSTSPTTESDSDSDSDSSGTESDEDRQQLIVAALERARRAASAASSAHKSADKGPFSEDVIHIGDDEAEKLPSLDPHLDKTYFDFASNERNQLPSSVRDPEVEAAERESAASQPVPPPPPPELSKSGKPLTRRERKEAKNKTAGPDWFDLPAPDAASLPRLYREVEALRLRNQLDPKRFYRKDEGAGKGVKGLPKHFAIGTIVASDLPFGGASGENLTRAERKRTIVEELVDDAEARRYAKKKFNEFQGVRTAAGRNTLHAKKRKPKW
ncbi:Fcf2-domain-containing protein [Fistulina hepatica ATCC 64428]|uniref:Fcf2-domain-containing protein n=1 Tax=Fistulina hepatica ATCC 64428 TaxID=1128425 RepID=A0A0D7A389_9AGAR|nr:Fcf2-domain-containing protein [Fistulina hepatica ATCC 64428]